MMLVVVGELLQGMLVRDQTSYAVGDHTRDCKLRLLCADYVKFDSDCDVWCWYDRWVLQGGLANAN